ncbi:hypothetical protein NQ318_018886 [Aromia moschata]|uniref:Uncharacterized protein n=1 Tax=Aromia moschata TaxID=1265417 RepID=A0AAV8ZJ84_9CUCU|nr:hypothetical protein NQ318_018886 [Aromia moschata]
MVTTNTGITDRLPVNLQPPPWQYDQLFGLPFLVPDFKLTHNYELVVHSQSQEGFGYQGLIDDREILKQN